MQVMERTLKIFLCNLFHFLYRITIANKNFTNKKRALFRSLLQCFDFSYIEINRGECHMLFSGNGIVSANIENNAITSENKNEALDMVLDSKLFF